MSRRDPAPAHLPRRLRGRPGRGIGSVAMVIVLVAMAALAAAVMRLGVQSATNATQSLLAARAQMAARSGIEWGLYQALKGSWTACAGATQTLDLSADGGMRVTVTCSMASYREGESAPATPATVRVYTLDAVACNTAAGACPNATDAGRLGYVERKVQSLVVN